MREEYYTFYDYMKQSNLTASEEDYLEMIYRLVIDLEGDTRINEIAKALNIKAPSVTRMMKKLTEKKLINYEPYGKIKLTETGEKIAEFLYYRHEVIYDFLDVIGIKDNKLKETEKMEHMLSKNTVECFKNITIFFQNNPSCYQIYKEIKKGQ